MPIRLGLIGRDGQEIPLEQENPASPREAKFGIFELGDASRRIVFKNVTQKPVALVAAAFFGARHARRRSRRSRPAADDRA